MPSESLVVAAELRGGSRGVDDLPARLRRETADLHSAVEASTGLPRSVRSVTEYTALLCRLHSFHVVAERALANPRWAAEWHALEIDLIRHQRAYLLESDLIAMSATPLSSPEPFVAIDTFAAALGCLYVVEGSSLGGRVIGPAIRASIGAVPTSFFDGAGRGHPSPWRALTTALRRFGVEGDGAAVVEGARATFVAFERHVVTAREGRP